MKDYKKIFSAFLIVFNKIPLIGNITYCTFQDHLFAFWEYLSTCLFSFLPLIIAFFADYLIDNSTTFSSSIISNVQNGELLIYTTSILSPVFYIIMRKRKGDNSFPNSAAYILLYVGIVVIASIVFALQRAQVILDPLSISFIQKICFIIGFFLFYFVLLYNNSLKRNPSETFREEADDFTDSFSQHRRMK